MSYCSQFKPGTQPVAAYEWDDPIALLLELMILLPALVIGLYLVWTGTGIGGLEAPVKMLY